MPRVRKTRMRTRNLVAAKMSSKLSDKKCPMCSFEAPTVKLVLNHLRNVHSNDPRFHVMCGIDGCARTYRKFSGLHSHLYRCHWTSSTRGTSQGLESTSAVTGADCMEISQPSDPGMTMDVVPGKVYVQVGPGKSVFSVRGQSLSRS